MMLLKIRRTAWSLALSTILCIGNLGFVTHSYAADAFTYTDKQTEVTIPESDVVVSGDLLVWFGKDDSGYKQIFTYNLETREQKQLTANRTYKQNLSVGGDDAVYLEDQRTIVLVNLKTGETINTDIKTLASNQPRTDGHYVIYDQENTIYIYDLETKQVSTIGKGNDPSIVDGVAVYVNSNGDLSLYDARTAKSQILWKPSMEFGGYIIGPPAFNGKNVVWTQYVSTKTSNYQTRIMNVQEIDPLPQVLKFSMDMPKFFVFTTTAISSSFTAWTTLENGNEKITAADLGTRQTGIVADSGEQIIGMDNDRLLLRDKDHHLLLRTLQPTGQGQTMTETIIPSAVPPLEGDREPGQGYGYLGGNDPISVMKVATSDNGAVVSSDNPSPYYGGGNYVSVTYEKENMTNLAMTKALAPGQKMVSYLWKVDLSDPLTDLKLTMSYLKQRVPSGAQDKLGIYLLDSGRWKYMGGILEPDGERLHIDTSLSGIYAVLYQDVPNGTIREYWRDKAVADFNTSKPIRVFLDGEEMTFHEQPVLKDGSTTVEFRPIFEKLGLHVDWDDDTQTVTGTKEGLSLKLTLGQTGAVVNGSNSELPAAPFLNQAYTFVPLRFVGEATGRKVLWDPNLKAVYIYDPATEGKLFYSDGSLLYEGQLMNGEMNGKGKFYRQDGALWYDAEFRGGEATGWGTIYYSGLLMGHDRTGDVTIGQIKGGIPDGYIVDINDNGDLQYEGEESHGVLNGKGKWYTSGRLVYDGEFKNGDYEGYGKYFNKDGTLDYEGYFVKSKPNGHGKEYRKDGTVYQEGEYVDGFLQKK
jgi:hypothetical protein